jgi:hypothetical protein
MSENESTPLERALVGELLTVLNWIEALPDEDIDPDTAVKIGEDVTAVVRGLGDGDRARFVAIAMSLANEADALRPGTGDRFRSELDAMGLLDEA